MDRLLREQPHVVAGCKDGSIWRIQIQEADSLKAAWQAGGAFWEGHDVYGSVLTVRLADIRGILIATDESIEREMADDALDKQRTLIRGEDR